MSNIEKCIITGQRGRGLGHVTYFLILELPLYLRNGSRYKLQIWCADSLQCVISKNANLRLNFGSPLHISGTAEATAFKFGVQIDYEDYSPEMQNYGTKGTAMSSIISHNQSTQWLLPRRTDFKLHCSAIATFASLVLVEGYPPSYLNWLWFVSLYSDIQKCEKYLVAVHVLFPGSGAYRRQ